MSSGRDAFSVVDCFVKEDGREEGYEGNNEDERRASGSSGDINWEEVDKKVDVVVEEGKDGTT